MEAEDVSLQFVVVLGQTPRLLRDKVGMILFPMCMKTKARETSASFEWNATARLITSSRNCDRITPIQIEPYWFPDSERIKLKILLLNFKALHQLSPTDIQDLLTR